MPDVPGLGKWGRVDPRGLLASQPSRTAKLQAAERPCFKKQSLEKEASVDLWPPCVRAYALTRAPMGTWAHKCTTCTYTRTRALTAVFELCPGFHLMLTVQSSLVRI